MAHVVDVQSLSHVQLFVTPWTATCQTSLSFPISWSLLKLMSLESVMPFNHLILFRPLSSCLQSFPASQSFPVSWFFTSGGQSIGAKVKDIFYIMTLDTHTHTCVMYTFHVTILFLPSLDSDHFCSIALKNTSHNLLT